MTHVIVAAVVLASLPVPARAIAQTTPDFSGTWTMDAARSVSAVQNEPARSKSLTIQHGPAELTIVRTTDGESFTTRYRAGAAGARVSGIEAPFQGIWYLDGETLVTETAGNVSDKTVRTKEVYALELNGSELTVETLLVVEHGYSMRGAQNHSSGKDVYRRAAR
ncbi:MAG: hypothetical protein OEW19_03340 [Acidobacteriota bacterium]|nr:hypothetical protein [Acidobacteriota bacterium]